MKCSYTVTERKGIIQITRVFHRSGVLVKHYKFSSNAALDYIQAYQFCSWSRQALGGPPMHAVCCLRFHSTSSSLIRAVCVCSVAFSSCIILFTTSYREYKITLFIKNTSYRKTKYCFS